MAVCGTDANASPHEDFLVGVGSTKFLTPEGSDFLNPQLVRRSGFACPSLAYNWGHTMSNRHALPTLPHPSLDLSETTAVQEY